MKGLKQLKGFTLVELLLVVSILAATSLIAVNVYYSADGDSVDRRAHIQLAQAEMLNIAKAVRQFKQDTGFYPGEGPFGYLDFSKCGGSCSCAADAGDADSIGGLDPVALDALALHRGVANTRDWLEAPANIVQLLVRPVICSNHALGRLSVWDETAQRGWRGPYISREGFADISDDLSPSGDGDPLAGGVLAARNIPAIADPFSNNKPEPVSPINVDGDSYLLDWRVFSADTTVYGGGQVKPGRLGSAYYLFGRDGCTPLRIVSMGPDGVYDSELGTTAYDPYGFGSPKNKCSLADSVALGTEALRATVCQPSANSDDLVMCL